MEVVKLNPEHKQKAAQVLAAAFNDYPEFRFYFPDDQRRKRCLPWYLGRVVDTAFNYGEVYTTQSIAGVVFILPPGHTRISQWEYIHSGFLPAPFVLGIPDFVRSQAGEDFIGNVHEAVLAERPHYYLWGLAVDPAQKGQGIGSALLQPLLAKADAEQQPIYLETHDERNVVYYQRFGFALARKSCLPNSDLVVWSMVREPAALS